MTDRERFEAWWQNKYHNGNPPRHGWEHYREGDSYSDEEFEGMWCAYQAALASQQPADDTWIEWAGGECPVVDGDIIHVKLRGGAQSGFSVCKPLSMQWAHEDNGWDIIAYRVVKP